MNRPSNTKSNMSFVRAFVLGRLRDQGPMGSRDFAGARRGEVSNEKEWAMPHLRALEKLGLAVSERVDRHQVFTITQKGIDEISDMPVTPARMNAMPDGHGVSLCLKSAQARLCEADPQTLSIDDVVGAMGLTGPLDAGELAEAQRILMILQGEERSEFEGDVLPETVGLRLCKISGADTLHLGEEVIFKEGRRSVIVTLSRAAISGHVGGEIFSSTCFWADQMDENGNSIGEIRLDRNSWNALKNRWMRCQMVS